MSHIKAGQAIFKIFVLLIILYGIALIFFDIDDEPIIATVLSILSFCWNHLIWSIVGFVGIGAIGALLQDMETKKESHGYSQKTIDTIAVFMGISAILIILLLLGAIIHISIVIMDGEFGEILSNFSFSYGILIPLFIALILFLISGASR